MFDGIGKSLGNMDDEYSRLIRNRQNSEAIASGNPLAFAEGVFNGTVGMDRNDPKAGAFNRGAGTAARYALPAAGVTLAGMALVDLAGQFGGGADQPEQNQLGLNNGELSTLGLIAAGVPLAAGLGAGGYDMFGGEEITAGNSQVSDYERQVNEAYAQSNADAIAKEASQRARGKGRTNLGQLPRSSRRR